MEDGFSSYSSLYDTSSLLQFCNGKPLTCFLPHLHLMISIPSSSLEELGHCCQRNVPGNGFSPLIGCSLSHRWTHVLQD
ncbi:hypothetical protein DNTS_027417 [Danionella cerebrum]|uniref:Uncharacterized protein n=1 Tax=Danionella cerebrum TaxID=2873325 RepID=A0A553N2N0_9TELE|nr:hypothetical protein DNTS_027417 [Danionella translucida]